MLVRPNANLRGSARTADVCSCWLLVGALSAGMLLGCRRHQSLQEAASMLLLLVLARLYAKRAYQRQIPRNEQTCLALIGLCGAIQRAGPHGLALICTGCANAFWVIAPKPVAWFPCMCSSSYQRACAWRLARRSCFAHSVAACRTPSTRAPPPTIILAARMRVLPTALTRQAGRRSSNSAASGSLSCSLSRGHALWLALARTCPRSPRSPPPLFPALYMLCTALGLEG